MHLSSVILIPHPDEIDAVRHRLAALDGVEVQAVAPAGQLILVLETADEATLLALYDTLGKLPGVLSVSMVYHQQEDAPDSEISIEA